MNGQKRFFLIFIAIIMFFLFIPSIVKGSEVSNYVNYKGQDEEGYHLIDYCIYTDTEKLENTIRVSNTLFSNNYFFILVYKTGYSVYLSTRPDVYIETIRYSGDTVLTLRLSYTGDGKTSDLPYYACNNDGSIKTSDKRSEIHSSTSHFSRIIYVKGLNLYRSVYDTDVNSYKNVAFSLFQDTSVLKTPRVTSYSGGFKLYLNDFVGTTTSDGVFEDIKSLLNVSMKVKDSSNNNLVSNIDNILANTDIQLDSSNRYYLDIPISGTLSTLHSKDGEYFIEFNFKLQSDRIFCAYNTYDAHKTVKTLFTYNDYSKYVYKKSTNSGVLIDVDKDGNEIIKPDPGGEDKPPEEVDKTEEAIKNQTQKIEEQTSAIKEQTEVSKNIFQQIIELPRKNRRFVT